MEQRYNYGVLDYLDKEIEKEILGKTISGVYQLEKEDMQMYGFPEGWILDICQVGKFGYRYVQITYPKGKLNYTRNYYALGPLCYAKQNGQEFVICATDYQCITIINVTTGERHTYGDKDAVLGGHGFCPVDITWDEEDNCMTIVGCIWAFPYERMVCDIPDLNNPIEGLNKAVYYDED